MKRLVFLSIVLLGGALAGGIVLLGPGSDVPPSPIAPLPVEPEGDAGTEEDALELELEARVRTAVPSEAALEALPPPSPVDEEEWSVNEGLPIEAQVLEVEEGEIQRARYGDGQLWYQGYQVRGEDGTLVREGPWEAWHPNGTLHELGAYRNDEEHGRWKWWYENGVAQAEGAFDEGEREGPWTFWHENGSRMMDARYLDGATIGVWTHYHENGRKRSEGEYVNGELHGRWTVWTEDGTVDPVRSGLYEHGRRVGP